MTKVLFLRHGESQYNVMGLCNADPSVPVPLTLKGRLQAEAAARDLKDVDIDLLLLSELPRARQTGLIINRYHDAPVVTDARLNDRRNGFEGKPVRNYLAAVEADPVGFRPAGGETYIELKARVFAFLNDLRATRADTVLVVTHHEVLQAVHGYFLGLSERAMWNIQVDHAKTLAFELPAGTPDSPS